MEGQGMGASTKQMSFLRKLYYKSDLINYESYDIFDDSHQNYLKAEDASTLISYKMNKDITLESEAREIIKNLETQI
jgi:hypothetical protein